MKVIRKRGSGGRWRERVRKWGTIVRPNHFKHTHAVRK